MKLKSSKVKKFLLGSLLVGGLGLSLTDRSSDNNDSNNDDKKTKTEVTIPVKKAKDKYGNVALFESSRSKIKFALTFVENYYEYVYFCGKAWTTGQGLTVLYNSDGTSKKVTQRTKVPTIAESDVYTGRYLTFEILPDIKNCITVPMDENTLIAACMLRYCIGHANFKKSSFVKQLNAGKKGAELAKTLTGWRQQEGVINRCYFFAALMADKIQFSDLLALRAEGCYNLTWKEMLVYSGNKPKSDKNDFYEWDFSKLPQNLKKAQNSRTAVLNLGKKKGHVKVKCKPVKELVPDYIWQEVSNNQPAQQRPDDNTNDDSGNAGYLVFGALGAAGAAYGAKKYLGQKNR